MKKISILAYPGSMGAEIFALNDTLTVANRVATALSGRDKPLFDIRIEGKDRRITLAGGVQLEPQVPHSRPDLLAIPGFEFSNVEELEERLPGYHRLCQHIASARSRGIPLASICVGSFLLAEAGVLDGRQATTAWLLAPEFHRRYPSVQLKEAELLIEDDGIITTGAFSSAMDLGLHLVKTHAGEELSHTLGKILLHETQRSNQARFIDRALMERRTGIFSSKVKRWLLQRLALPYRLEELADAFHVSTRTLHRRFKTETDMSPLAYVRKARIEAAKKMLSFTEFNVSEITERLGYEDVSSFTRMFNQQVGCSPTRYRQQFRGETKGRF